MAQAPAGWRFTGIEAEAVSARIARVLFPAADIRHEIMQRARLAAGSFDAVLGNVPFAEITVPWQGQTFALHDFCIVRAVEGLKPGGIAAVLTSRYTLDKEDRRARDWLGDRADLLAAIRLPAGAFDGTRVVADLLVLRRRKPIRPGVRPSRRRSMAKPTA